MRPPRASCCWCTATRGYLNLCELISRAWTQKMVRDQAVVKLQWLKALSEGLIALSAGANLPLLVVLIWLADNREMPYLSRQQRKLERLSFGMN